MNLNLNFIWYSCDHTIEGCVGTRLRELMINKERVTMKALVCVVMLRHWTMVGQISCNHNTFYYHDNTKARIPQHIAVNLRICPQVKRSVSQAVVTQKVCSVLIHCRWNVDRQPQQYA